MVDRGTMLQLLLPWLLCLRTEGGLEVNRCGLPPQSTALDLYTIKSLYSPSLISCSSLCATNSSCVSYIFSNNMCTLYSNQGNVPATVSIANVLCKRPTQSRPPTIQTPTLPPMLVGCPKQIDNSTLKCLPLSSNTNTSATCTCVTTTKFMNWTSAADFCQQYSMTLVAVPTAVKHSHINQLLTAYMTNTTIGLWTSGRRMKQTINSYVWTSINVTLPLPGPTTTSFFWLKGQPDNPLTAPACVDYRYVNATASWLYGDHVCNESNWRVICEYSF